MEDLKKLYGSHAARGADLVVQGRFIEALAEYSDAQKVARKSGEQDLVYKATLNLSMVRLEMGETRAAEKGLREIILRSGSDRIILGAAYNLAVSLRKQANHGRALVYARRAVEIAKRLKEHAALAMCHNLLGNIYLGQSMLDQALAEYRRSLQLRRREKADNRFSLAILMENIGYCLLLKRRFRRGVSRIQQALDLAGETGDLRCQADCWQDLCYARMHLGEYREGIACGERALDLALAQAYRDIEKNCYYLLGEIHHLEGNDRLRDRYFNRLQKQYPGIPFLRDFLCAIDVSGIINLKG